MPTYAGHFLTKLLEDYLNNPDGSDSNAFGIPPNDKLLALNFACVKATERARWMNSAEGFAAMRQAYEAQGIGVLPWCLPHGANEADAYAEGQAAAETLAILGGFMQVDLEDGHAESYYWVGGEAEVDAFGRGFTEHGGGGICLLPDSRGDKLAGEKFWYWHGRPWMNPRVHPQAYASIFYTPRPGRQKLGIDAATHALLDGGIAPHLLFPVLSTTDNAGKNPISGGELQEGILYCHEQGFGGFFIWRRGLLTPEQRDAMLSLDDPWGNVTPPIPQPPSQAPKQIALAHIEAARIAIEGIPDK